MTARVYKNKFTLDGRVKPTAGVNPAKVNAMRGLVEGAMTGNRIALGTLQEAMTTSDAIFSFAHLVNLNFLPRFDEAPRTWSTIAGTRSVSDFRPAVLYSLAGEWEDGTLGTGTPRHIAPVVPEGAAYPYSYMAGETSQSAGVQKRGFKTDFTFEAFINDPVGFIAALPSEMVRVALDTEEYEVYSALIGGVGAGQQLDGGTTPDGTVVPANAALARASLVQALVELLSREIGGRKVQVNGGYNLIVASGQEVYAEFILNNLLLTDIRQGALTLGVNGYNPLANITVVGSEYVTGAAWYLVPKPGTTRRPIVERLQLVGHEAPELRVDNATGNYIGGGVVSPFEGSFSNDSATFRLRQIGNGTLWTPDLVIYSTGAGGAPTPPVLTVTTTP